MFHDFPMFSHDFPWNAEHIYANLCLGALSFSLFASRETFLLARSTIRRAVCTSFYVRWIANNNSHQRIQQTWGVHSFNKHEKFTVAKLGAEKPTFMVCHGVSMSWFLRTNRQKIGQSPRDASGPSHAAWPSGDEAVQPNPQSTRFKNVATMAHDTGSG